MASSTHSGEQRRDRALRLRQIAGAEQVQVIQHVVEVVKRTPQRIAVGERPRIAVRGMEVAAKSAEQLGHRDVGLAIADVDRRVEDDRRAIRQAGGVARPQVAVQERRRGFVPAQQRRQRGEQALALALQRARVAVARSERELRREALVTEESAPVVGPAVALRCATDPVVAMPAEALARRAVKRAASMQRGQRGAKRPVVANCARIEMFEHQERGIAGGALGDDRGHAHDAGRGERAQSVGFGVEHVGKASGRLFDEKNSCAGLEAPCPRPRARSRGVPADIRRRADRGNDGVAPPRFGTRHRNGPRKSGTSGRSRVPVDRTIAAAGSALLAQRVDAARNAVERQGKHPRPERLQDQLRRARVFPAARRFRIPPDHLAEVAEDPAEPFEPRLDVAVLDAAVDGRQFVGTHRRVADEDHAPVRTVGANEVERAGAFALAPRVVAPDVVIDAVVEIEILEVAELRLRGREELLAYRDVGVHRAADVEKQQHLDAIAPLRLQPQVEPAGVARRALDRAVEIELLRHAFAREASQPAQRHFQVARVELDVAIQVAKVARVPHLHRRARAAAVLAHADAFRVVAVGAERTGSAGPDPFLAALVPALLFLQALLERLQQLVEPAHRFDALAVLLGQVAQEFLLQPFLGDLAADVEDAFDALEVRAEREVEAVEVLLVLDEGEARQRVEVVERQRHHALVERLDQRQILTRADRQLERLEVKEEVDEHRGSAPIAGGTGA